MPASTHRCRDRGGPRCFDADELVDGSQDRVFVDGPQTWMTGHRTIARPGQRAGSVLVAKDD